MLSKPSTVVLPALLLLCLWWQQQLRQRQIAKVVPFFTMALAMSVLTITEQRLHIRGDRSAEWSLGAVERCLLAAKAIWFYASKVVWPTKLMFVYPRWEMQPNSIQDWLPLIGLLVVATLLWIRRQQPWARVCVFGLGFFVTALLPVLGFFNIYYFRYSFAADHFQYLGSLGLVACATCGILWVMRKWPAPKIYTVCLGLLVTLGVLTWRQARMYSNAERLYRTTIEQNPACWLARNNLGVMLLDGGKAQEAVIHFEQALRVNPNSYEVDNNLGKALYKLGRVPEAKAHFEKALKLNPRYYPAHNKLGDVLLNEGRIQDAIEHFEWALRINPSYAYARNNLGNALFITGNFRLAIEHYQQALRLKPDYADAHNNLGVALMQAGKMEEAIGQFQQALQIQPDSAEPHRNWGHAMERLDKIQEAVDQYEQALRIKPDHVQARNDLGSALLRKGKVQDSILQYEAALRTKPDDAFTQNNLAWVLAISTPTEGGDPARAVTLAKRACELSGNKVPAHLDTLAAAYAAAGRFNDAVAAAEKAIELAGSASQPEIAKEIESHLRLYRDGKAYHQPDPVNSSPTQP
jgi:tetratricopeptide (TPR) repeat protein